MKQMMASMAIAAPSFSSDFDGLFWVCRDAACFKSRPIPAYFWNSSLHARQSESFGLLAWLSNEVDGEGLADFSTLPGVPVPVPVGVFTSLSADSTLRIATDLISFFGVESWGFEVLAGRGCEGDFGALV